LTRNSVTVIDDSIEDSWRLCHNEAEKKLRDSGYFLGIRLLTPHYNEPANYYIKPLPSCASNVKARRAELGIYTDAEHQFQLQRKMLTMQDDTQWDIQKLTEARDKASSNEPVKRSWEVLLLKGLNNKRFEIDSEKRKWWLNQQLASSPPDLQQPRVGNPSRQTHGETASQTNHPQIVSPVVPPESSIQLHDMSSGEADESPPPDEDLAGNRTQWIRAESRQSIFKLPLCGVAVFLAPVIVVSGMTASHGDNWKLAFLG
jgi:hypothetical protein